MPEKYPVRKKLLLVLKILLSALAIFIILKKVELHKVSQLLISVRLPWLFAAFAVFFFSKTVSAIRMNLYFKQHNIGLTEKQNFFLYLLGMFYNLFVPLAGGEAYKIYWLNKHRHTPVKSLIWASLNDRLSGLVALTFFALLFFGWSSVPVTHKQYALLLIPAGYWIYYLEINFFFAEYMPVFHRSNILSVIVQATQILCSFCVLMSLSVSAHFTDYLFIFLLSCYAYMIPITGAREMAFVYGADVLHLDVNLSLTISLFFYLSLAVTSLSGVVFLYFPSLLNRK